MAKDRQMKNYIFSLFILFSLFSFAQQKETAGIFASKMNVLYKNVENPIQIPASFAYDSLKVTSDIGNINHRKAIVFKTDSGVVANIKAIIYLPDNDSIILKRAFRIKPVPKPEGLVRGVSNLATDIQSITHLKVEAAIPDFEFPIMLEVTSFILRISGKQPLNIEGNELNSAAEYFQNLRKDEIILIENITAINVLDKTDKTIYRPSDVILKIFF